VPLYRNATFLLGLFPIVILLWAWADSARNSTTWFRCQQPEQAILIGMAGSNLGIGTIHLRPEAEHRRILTITPGYGRTERLPLPKEKIRIFPSLTGPDRSFEVFRDLRLSARRLPFWFIIACYLPLWLAASWWHARVLRKRVLAALPA
jgi:hypothetical protein